MSEQSLSRQRVNFIAMRVRDCSWSCAPFSHLGAIGLVGPDEPRYAWIARAMATSGDWVTPRLYGEPWFEKPALYYWAAALGFAAHLPAEWAARLPSAFAALVAAIAIGWLGRKFYSDENRWPFASAFLACSSYFFDERCCDRVRARGGSRYVLQRRSHPRDGKRHDCARSSRGFPF